MNKLEKIVVITQITIVGIFNAIIGFSLTPTFSDLPNKLVFMTLGSVGLLNIYLGLWKIIK
jgi:hypothetical protein